MSFGPSVTATPGSLAVCLMVNQRLYSALAAR